MVGEEAALENGKLSQPAMRPAEPAFEGLAHVEEQVSSVGNLESGGSARGGGSGVFGRAVAGDELDAGMATQLLGDGRS